MTIKTLEWGRWRSSGVFIVNCEHISHLLLVFPFRTLSVYLFALCDLFHISIVFRFDGFKFCLFLKRIFTMLNISAKWNPQGVWFKKMKWKMHFNKHVHTIPYSFSRRFIILYCPIWTDIFRQNGEYELKKKFGVKHVLDKSKR